MSGGDPGLATAAQHAGEARLAAYAAASGVAVRRGRGWLAVRTGIDSNDMNGVVSSDDAAVSERLVEGLLGWLDGVPASWLTSRPHRRVTDMLVGAGARAERTGHWSGRSIPSRLPAISGGVTVHRVSSDRDLDRWLNVATECEWIETVHDRAARRNLYLNVGLDDAGLSHWLASADDKAVGFASAFIWNSVVDLCNLGVLESHRRRGIGRALVTARLADAAARGATIVVSAPSPDGWELQRALGFRSVRVIPDTWFYLPTDRSR